MQVDIAAETLKVGNAITSVRIDQMILNLAKGIAWGQYELDKVGVDITRMMGVPGTVSIGGEQLSMLEAGFIPSFYHFVDTILEMKMEVNIREEQSSSMGYKQSMQRSMEMEAGAEVSAKVGVNTYLVNTEVGMKAHWKQKTSAAYSQSVDAKHSQKFSQDLSATSLMRTKIVPVPPPELLVERIKILLEALRNEALAEEAEQGFFFNIDWSDNFDTQLNGGGVPEELNAGFTNKNKPLSQELLELSKKEDEENVWLLKSDDDSYRLKKVENSLKVYIELSQEERRSVDDILMENVENRLLERMGEIAG
jgi:hypothetical protein